MGPIQNEAEGGGVKGLLHSRPNVASAIRDAAHLSGFRPALQAGEAEKIFKSGVELRGGPNGVKAAFDFAWHLDQPELGLFPTAVLVAFRATSFGGSLGLLPLRRGDFLQGRDRNHAAVVFSLEFDAAGTQPV